MDLSVRPTPLPLPETHWHLQQSITAFNAHQHKVVSIVTALLQQIIGHRKDESPSFLPICNVAKHTQNTPRLADDTDEK